MNIVSTIIISIVSLIISTAGFVVSYFAFRRGVPRVKVVSNLGFLAGPNYFDKNTYLFFNATNISQRSITLNVVGFILYQSFKFQRKNRFIIPLPTTRQTFPIELTDGKRFSCWTTTKQLINILEEVGIKSGIVYLKPYFLDAAGNRFFSKKVKFSLSKAKKELEETI
jgi:hypothetical protein